MANKFLNDIQRNKKIVHNFIKGSHQEWTTSWEEMEAVLEVQLEISQEVARVRQCSSFKCFLHEFYCTYRV